MSTDARRTAGAAGEGAKWIAVDLGRIVRLPQSLKRLWPAELMPRGPADLPSGSVDPPSGSGDLPAPPPPSRRGPDVLTAWLTGFASELGLADSRLTIVISSGVASVHVELAAHDDIALAILALRGEAFDGMSGCQLLRRVNLAELPTVVEGLSGLVEDDCVLTLTCLHACGRAGMEFLHRQGSRWKRPELERGRDGVSVGGQVDAGDDAVRVLLASVLTGLRFSTAETTTAHEGSRAAPAEAKGAGR